MSISTSLSFYAKSLIYPQAIAVGSKAPPLSLTASEGTWVRTADCEGQIHIVLLFFRTMNRDEVDAWLREYSQLFEAFEELDCAVFGINTSRTDKLRAYQTELGLSFHLLYDPFALDSRQYGFSGRRPSIRNGAVLINKDGEISFSERGLPSAHALLELVAKLEGKDIQPESPASTMNAGAPVRNPGQRPDEVRFLSTEDTLSKLQDSDNPHLLVDVRTTPEYEADHVPGVIHIPVDEIHHRYRDLGQSNQLIFICQAGGRAYSAAEFMSSIGSTEIYVVEGGMSAWSGPRKTGGKSE